MIKKIERMVLTTSNINKTIEFYEILGFEVAVENGNFSLRLDDFEIELNVKEMPNTEVILPLNLSKGCESLAFTVDESIDNVMRELMDNNIKIEGGVIVKDNSKKIIVKDPDNNIIELVSYV